MTSVHETRTRVNERVGVSPMPIGGCVHGLAGITDG